VEAEAVAEEVAPQGGLMAVEQVQGVGGINLQLLAVHLLQQQLERVADLAELGGAVGHVDQAFLLHLGAAKAHGAVLAVALAAQFLQVDVQVFLFGIDGRGLGALVAALLPAQHGHVLHQHVLGGGEGMKGFGEAGQYCLVLLRVFARRQHECLRGLGIKAIPQGVVGDLLLALRGARPSGFLGVLAIRLGHARRHFSSFESHCVSPCGCLLSPWSLVLSPLFFLLGALVHPLRLVARTSGFKVRGCPRFSSRHTRVRVTE
jgi:hypothetical protein